MARKSQTNFINILQKLSKKLNLKKDTGNLFESQENCRMIKTKFRKEKFSFEVFTEDVVGNAIKNLPTGKASVSNDILVSIMKETIDACRLKLTQIMDDCLKNNFYSDILKNPEKILRKEIMAKKKI